MKRLRSSDDLRSLGEKGFSREHDSNRPSSSHRSYYYKSGCKSDYKSDYKSDNGWKGSSWSYSSRYVDEERDSSRVARKRSEYHSEGFDRRKAFDRYRECGDRGGGLASSSPRGGDRIRRSESFCVPRRDIPKGFRSERDRSRREGSVSSWRRFGGQRDHDDGGRSSSDSGRGNRSGLEDRGSTRSPRGSRDAKSPAWSKDSGRSEKSKSVEVKKNKEVQVESGSSSEMEEGELEPEKALVCQGELRDELRAQSGSNEVVEAAEMVEIAVTEKGLPEHEPKTEGNTESRLAMEPSKEIACEGNLEETETSQIADVAVKEVSSSLDCKMLTNGVDDRSNVLKPDERDICLREANESEDVDKSSPSLEEPKDVKSRDNEVEQTIGSQETNMESSTGNGVPRLEVITEKLNEDDKDIDKIALSPSPNNDASAGGEACTQRRFGNPMTCEEDYTKGPSSRGFELFPGTLVKPLAKKKLYDSNKLKDENLTLEPLDLSLSLPTVILPRSSYEVNPATDSSSHERGFNGQLLFPEPSSPTASMSFSGSQQFTHNPSCSLTHNSSDIYELSVGSRPIFQGIDQGFQGSWHGLSPSENKETPLYNGVLMNGNSTLHQSSASQAIISGQVVESQNFPRSEGISKSASRLDRQPSSNKLLAGVERRHYSDARSPTQHVGFLQRGSECNKDRKQMMVVNNVESACRNGNLKENGHILSVGVDVLEMMITMVVSEPIHVTAARFQEMSEQSLTCLRESVSEILTKAGKHGQRLKFQKSLQKRSDITLEMLLQCPRSQLEVMVALKTGLAEFLQQFNSISTAVLAEIFLDIRCRNPNCRNLLPVDECDCKICSQKNGFCSSCMCLICSKFDTASNTCSWVGCDVCLHWCHTDCGLRECLIRNEPSVRGIQGSTEMQSHCVACGHPSEMFGFIKEVFQNFAMSWSSETLLKELQYVRRIFCASKDEKGKQLNDLAEQMLARLTSGSNVQDAINPILSFLSGGYANYGCGTNLSGKEQGEGSNKITQWAHETMELNSVYSGNAPQLQRTSSIPSGFDCNRNDKHKLPELLGGSLKEPIFHELESIVRVKQADAKMFQARADDARREAEGLKRIAIAKNDKIDEEFASRIAKLRLAEAEHMRKLKLEQLQAFERAHREYFNMKTRMEADIKDLLGKMEATKQNLATH